MNSGHADAQRAQAGAEREHEGWRDEVRARLLEYLTVMGKQPFPAEAFRAYAYAKGLPVPTNQRAFGAVMLWARRNGHIEIVGTQMSEGLPEFDAPTTNSTIVTQWRAKQ